jgi:Flp pilus assembly protein TadG
MKAKLLKEQRGQSLTEFAIIAPVLLLLVFGIVDLGRFLYEYLHLQMASQEAVRLGGFGRTDAEIESFARSYTGESDPAALKVTVTPPDTGRDSGDYVTVTLEAPFEFVTPLAADIIPGFGGVTAKSTIRVE